MVTGVLENLLALAERFAAACRLLAAEDGRPLIERLDPITRTKVVMALAGLLVLGFGLVLLAWLGARMVRRHAQPPGGRSSLSRGRSVSEDDWWSKPLVSDGLTAEEDDDDGQVGG